MLGSTVANQRPRSVSNIAPALRRQQKFCVHQSASPAMMRRTLVSTHNSAQEGRYQASRQGGSTAARRTQARSNARKAHLRGGGTDVAPDAHALLRSKRRRRHHGQARREQEHKGTHGERECRGREGEEAVMSIQHRRRAKGLSSSRLFNVGTRLPAHALTVHIADTAREEEQRRQSARCCLAPRRKDAGAARNSAPGYRQGACALL